MAKIPKNKGKCWLDIVMGSIIGFINGFLGSGGGMVTVPILEKLKKLDSQKSHATAIAVMFPLSLISGVIYCLNFQLDWLNVLIISLSATAGGVLGCFFLKKLSGKAIKIIFSVVMIFAGVWTIVV
jgi:uncharacterized membrane protein YfcA